jgi:hypothetical protein
MLTGRCVKTEVIFTIQFTQDELFFVEKNLFQGDQPLLGLKQSHEVKTSVNFPDSVGRVLQFFLVLATEPHIALTQRWYHPQQDGFQLELYTLGFQCLLDHVNILSPELSASRKSDRL